MKILIAIDSFKGCLTSFEAGTAVKEGILRAISDAEIVLKPVSDGGEGMTDAFMDIFDCKPVCVTVSDPLMRKINAVYGYNAGKRLAVMEMAAAAGLPLLEESERNPMRTTTFGVGEMIKDAIKSKSTKIIRIVLIYMYH